MKTMSNKLQTTKKIVLLSSFGTLMTILFVFLGAPFLRVLRGAYGAVIYWLIGGALLLGLSGLGLSLLGFLVFSIWCTVGIYQEFEQRGRASLGAAAISVFIGTCFVILGPIWVYKLSDVSLTEVLKEGVSQVINQSKTLKEGQTTMMGIVDINVDTLIAQIPSALALCQMLSLAFALILDRKTAAMFGVRYEKVASQMRLLDFRLPDFLIWPALISFLFAFLKVNPPIVNTVAINLFSIFLGLFFFQGLAVLEVALIIFRAGFITRLLVYLLIVGQLFFLLSGVGLIDYWLDFRARLKRIRSLGQQEKNEEHL